MPLFHLAILALIQGFTEFLPISSSGHLALLPMLTDWPDQGRMMDVAVHVGTLGAVMLYAWRDIGAMLTGIFQVLKGRRAEGAHLFAKLVVATIPVVVAGYLVAEHLDFNMRTLEIIAWATLGFGVLLGVADRVGMTMRRIEHCGYGEALFIGCAQALALIPGTSRSGITITAGRILGLERVEAARYSFLLSIPAILGAGLLEGKELLETGDLALTGDAAIAAGLSFVAALITINLMMAWLRRAGFMPFVLYRIALGGGLLAWIYFW